MGFIQWTKGSDNFDSEIVEDRDKQEGDHQSVASLICGSCFEIRFPGPPLVFPASGRHRFCESSKYHPVPLSECGEMGSVVQGWDQGWLGHNTFAFQTYPLRHLCTPNADPCAVFSTFTNFGTCFLSSVFSSSSRRLSHSDLWADLSPSVVELMVLHRLV